MYKTWILIIWKFSLSKFNVGVNNRYQKVKITLIKYCWSFSLLTLALHSMHNQPNVNLHVKHSPSSKDVDETGSTWNYLLTMKDY